MKTIKLTMLRTENYVDVVRETATAAAAATATATAEVVTQRKQ